jgi:hypothetical protein
MRYAVLFRVMYSERDFPEPRRSARPDTDTSFARGFVLGSGTP